MNQKKIPYPRREVATDTISGTLARDRRITMNTASFHSSRPPKSEPDNPQYHRPGRASTVILYACYDRKCRPIAPGRLGSVIQVNFWAFYFRPGDSPPPSPLSHRRLSDGANFASDGRKVWFTMVMNGDVNDKKTITAPSWTTGGYPRNQVISIDTIA